MDDVKERYFEWMCSKIIRPGHPYNKLLHRLHEIPFTYILPMDENRMTDGYDLRYRFGHEAGIPDAIIVNALDQDECSVLEMMAALCIRCEESIMDDPDIGNRTSEWFVNMIKTLGLGGMTDDGYDEGYVDYRIDIFLRGRYAPDGNGGLFRLKHCTDDLRNVQIWYQMNWYLNEIMEN